MNTMIFQQVMKELHDVIIVKVLILENDKKKLCII